MVIPKGLKKSTPDTIPDKYRDFRIWSGYNLIESLKGEGQLNPNIGSYYNNDWVIEPGQTRWFALFELGEKTQRVLIKVLKGEEEKFFEYFKKYSYEEIYNMKEAILLFKSTKREDCRGIEYLNINKWFQED